VIIGGGGSSSSNAGGLNDGARSKCIGLLTEELGSCTCAAGGRVRDSVDKSRPDDEAFFPLRRELRVGSRDDGEFLRLGAPGQPHSKCSVSRLTDSGEVYAGRAVFACVAWQERMLKGESIEISKCRRFVGSTASGLDKRITIYERVSQCCSMGHGSRIYLDPVVHLDIVIRGVEMDPSIPFLLFHCMATW